MPPAVAFAAGIASASLCGDAVPWVVWLAALVAGGALAVLGRTGWAAGALLIGVAALGALRAAEAPLAPDHVRRLPLPTIAHIEGRLAAEPRYWAPDRVRLWLDALRADGAPASGRIQVSAYGVPPALTVGQRIAAPLRLHQATGFRNQCRHLGSKRLSSRVRGSALRRDSNQATTDPLPQTIAATAIKES